MTEESCLFFGGSSTETAKKKRGGNLDKGKKTASLSRR